MEDMHEVKKGMYELEKTMDVVQSKTKLIALYAENLEERLQKVLETPPNVENAKK